MKRTIIALAACLMLSATAQAQLRYGVRAGYGLNNLRAVPQNATTRISLGINHGFYAGVELRYGFGDMLGVQAALQFEKMGARFYSDLGKSEKTFMDIVYNDLKGLQLSKSEKDSLMAQFGLVSNSETTTEFTLNTYNVALPISLHFKFGSLGVLAGVDLRYTVSSKVTMAMKEPGQPTVDESVLADFLPYAAYIIDGGTPPATGATMPLQKFYNDYLEQRFGFGLHLGADYEIYENVTLQAVYHWGLSSILRKPWSNVSSLKPNSLQVGMSYMF